MKKPTRVNPKGVPLFAVRERVGLGQGRPKVQKERKNDCSAFRRSEFSELSFEDGETNLKKSNFVQQTQPKKQNLVFDKRGFVLLVGDEGFEPPMQGPEPCALPLG